jgi:Flp pilus assembly secretin CpaC
VLGSFANKRFAIVAALALGHWSAANAGSSFKVVQPPSDAQQAPAVDAGSSIKVVSSPVEAKQGPVELAQAVVPSPDEFSPGEQPSVASRQPSGKAIDMLLGIAQQLKLNWNIKEVYPGDPNIIDAIPINNTTLLLEGKAQGRTNITIIGEDSNSQVAIYYVSVHTRIPPEVEIHSTQKVVNWVAYECSSNGCEYLAAHQIKAEDLPKGYTNNTQQVQENLNQNITNPTKP